MKAIDRFLWMVKGVRVLPPEPDEPHTKGGCFESDLRVILGEVAQRASDDLKEAMKRGEERPKKRNRVITTTDLYDRKGKVITTNDGPRIRLIDDPIPGLDPARLTLRERWRRLWGKGRV
jgi:hypothetical protein